VVFFNYASKEITTKIVFYGPGLSGKTTNLQYLYATLPKEGKGKMLSLKTKDDRTLFFDFLPIDLGTIKGMRIRLQLCTVPGQVFYNSTRKLVLKGVDGVVFVADSQEGKLEANIKSFTNLEQNLLEQGKKTENMPLVIQLNKRDLNPLISAELLNEKLNYLGVPVFEAIATRGEGVNDSLIEITRLVLEDLKRKHNLDFNTAASLKSLIVPEPDGEERILKKRGPLFGGSVRPAGGSGGTTETPRPADAGVIDSGLESEGGSRAESIQDDRIFTVESEGVKRIQPHSQMEKEPAVETNKFAGGPQYDTDKNIEAEFDLKLKGEKETAAVGVADEIQETIEVPIFLKIDRTASCVKLKLNLKITFTD